MITILHITSTNTNIGSNVNTNIKGIKVSKALGSIIFVVLTIAYLSIFYFLASNAPRERVYDCSIAEISPDYPVEVKEGCRKLRSHKLVTT